MNKLCKLFTLSILIIITFSSCDSRSEIQIKESEELYDCLCDQLAIERAIVNFRKDVGSYFADSIPELILKTNSCYLELFNVQEELRKKLDEKSEELKRWNLGYISNISDTEEGYLGYIKGSDYEIHILKPAKRKLAKYCRKVYELKNPSCFSKKSNKRQNLWENPKNDDKDDRRIAKPSIFLNKQLSHINDKLNKKRIPYYQEYIENDFFNWIKFIYTNNKRWYKSQNKAKSFGELALVHFNDHGIYRVYNNVSHNTITFEDLANDKLENEIYQIRDSMTNQIPEKYHGAFGSMQNKTFPINSSFAEDSKGQVYFSKSNSLQLSAYKLDTTPNYSKKIHTYPSNDSIKSWFLPQHLHKLRTHKIEGSHMFFVEDKMFIATAIFTRENSDSDINRLNFLEFSDHSNVSLHNFGKNIDPFDLKFVSEYYWIMGVKAIDENNVLILFQGEEDNSSTIMKYNLKDKEVKSTYVNNARSNERQKVSFFAINNEAGTKSIWNAVKVHETEYRISCSLDQGNNWQSFAIPIPKR